MKKTSKDAPETAQTETSVHAESAPAEQPPAEAAAPPEAPAPEVKPDAPVEKKPEEKPDHSPRAHAIALGYAPRPRKNGLTASINGARIEIGSRPRGSWQHEAASILHGWQEHLHHTGEHIQISSADYELALEAATKTNEAGDYVPHQPALSPHKGKGL
jgi:outer membrane biosynthesis protein TonB